MRHGINMQIVFRLASGPEISPKFERTSAERRRHPFQSSAAGRGAYYPPRWPLLIPAAQKRLDPSPPYRHA